MKSLETGFTPKVLLEISPFSVDFSRTTKVKRTTKNGGTYEKKLVVVESSGFQNDFEVELTSDQYQALRILSLRGIKTFAATYVEPKKEGGFGSYLFSGAT